MFNALPFYFYMIFPSFAVVILTIIPVIAGRFIKFGDLSEIVLVKMRQAVGMLEARGERRLLHREVKSLRVLRIPAGIGNMQFFQIKGATICDFYSNISICTINLLLCVKI